MLDDQKMRSKIAAILSAGGMTFLAASCATVEPGPRPGASGSYHEERAESDDRADDDAPTKDDEKRFEDLNRPLYSVEESE